MKDLKPITDINITTTHTITCENAPVQEVYDELEVRFPSINPLARELRVARSEIEKLTRDRDEVQRRLEESWAIKEKLMAENANLEAANDVILAGGSRPALPEGMRIAEHEKYGRVIVSPGADFMGNREAYFSYSQGLCGTGMMKVLPSALTFLDSEPGPAPLPKPEDCKPGELYLGVALGREVVATRCDPGDDHFPWVTSAIDSCYSNWCKDSQITLLARLLPDRDIKEQA